MEKKTKRIISYAVIFLSFALILGGLIVNPSRISNNYPKNYTAKILGLPEGTWVPFLYSEHLFGAFAISIIAFTIFCMVWLLVELIGRLIAKLTSENYKNCFNSMISVCGYIGLFVGLIIPSFWEIWIQKAATIEQLPFDFLGVFCYWFYIKWIYR